MNEIYFVMKSSKKRFKVHQMTNDWLTSDGYNGQPLNLRTLRIEEQSIPEVVRRHEEGDLNIMFTHLYDLDHFKSTGEFKRKTV